MKYLAFIFVLLIAGCASPLVPSKGAAAGIAAADASNDGVIANINDTFPFTHDKGKLLLTSALNGAKQTHVHLQGADMANDAQSAACAKIQRDYDKLYDSIECRIGRVVRASFWTILISTPILLGIFAAIKIFMPTSALVGIASWALNFIPGANSVTDKAAVSVAARKAVKKRLAKK